MHYCDTSFLVPLFLAEATSEQVEQFVSDLEPGVLAVSEWTQLEMAAVLARRVRMGLTAPSMARAIDDEVASAFQHSFVLWPPQAADYRLARDYLRQYQTALRGGDALHLAIAANRQAEAIYTLDQCMLKAGRLLRLPVATGIRLRR